jgi:hypothetical protein
MPTIVPHRFLVRFCHPVPYQKAMPRTGPHVVQLPESTRLDNFAALEGLENFADVRVAWNELGLGIQVTVAGKKLPVECDADQPLSSDGLVLWIDTRGDRTAHRASRYCHQFALLPSGGGADKNEPSLVQSKINRALMDAPLHGAAEIPFHAFVGKGGYTLEAFFPLAVLNGYDPEQHPRLGLCYAIRDAELGDQYLGMNRDFPIADDPSLWHSIELVKSSAPGDP